MITNGDMLQSLDDNYSIQTLKGYQLNSVEQSIHLRINIVYMNYKCKQMAKKYECTVFWALKIGHKYINKFPDHNKM